MVLSVEAAAEIPLAERRSGYEFMSRETKAMQDDEVTGPAALFLLDGEGLWNRNCQGCHKDMSGVASRYPKYDAKRGRPISLEQKINACRVERQKQPAFAYESRELLALSAYVGRQARGFPIDIPIDDKTRPFLEAGKATFFRRMGQLNLACNQCHDDNWGKKLAGNPIPQGHPTGYPIYRLEWQGMGSLQRRLRNCLTGIRAEPYALGSDELVDLELYLAWRARGMKLETPAVRP